MTSNLRRRAADSLEAVAGGRNPAVSSAKREGLDLFFYRLDYERTESNEAQATNIIRRFECLPLAIDQAAAYIKTRNLSLANFNALYSRSSTAAIWSDVPPLWEYRKQSPGTETFTQLSVRTTFELSLQELQRNADDVSKLLSFFSLFNCTDLSEELSMAAVDIADRQTHPPSWARTFLTEDGIWDRAKFQDLIVELHSLSLVQNIELSSEYASFSIHPMIGEWLQIRIEASQRQTFAEIAINSIAVILNRHLDGLDSMLFSRRQWLLMHIDCMWQTCEFLSEGLGSMHWDNVPISTLRILAKFFARNERYELAEGLYKRSLTRCQNEDTKSIHDDAILFDLHHDLGVCYMDKVDYLRALQMFNKAIEAKTPALGPDHLSTLQSIKQLGTVYRRLQRYQESTKMLELVVTKMRDLHGPDDIRCLEAANNLAVVYRYAGRLDEAMEMVQQTLTGKLRSVGGENTSTLTTMRCMGLIYRDLGNDTEAERLFLRALAGQERLTGMMHASTLYTASLLEKTYRRLGKQEDAEKMREKMQGDLGMAIIRASRWATDS